MTERKPVMPPEAYFWMYVEKTEGCWNWTGAKTQAGYGEFHNHYGTFYAHRFSWELVNGPIPKGLVIDHLCGNRACVNPAHMEPTTIIENVERGKPNPFKANREKTHCPRGHPLVEGNLTAYSVRHGTRECLICSRVKARLRSRERWAKYKANQTR